MEAYKHSVLLDRRKCTGCIICLHHCPTEAIRIVNGHAVINQHRCIDCGECIRMCPQNAKRAVSGKLDSMNRFRYKIALPSPSLYGQFNNMDDVNYILNGLLKIGFDDVFEVAKAAELVTDYTRRHLESHKSSEPLISSACPAIIRLISLVYPSLEDNILHLLPPMEVAAQLARKKARALHPELEDKDIGICFISPCPSMVSYVRNNFGSYHSRIDEVVPISDVYFRLLQVMKPGEEKKTLCETGKRGVLWAESGGEATALPDEGYLTADGIRNVRKVLDELENGTLRDVRFVELRACPGGCVGGVMTVQNPHIAKARLRTITRNLPSARNFLSEDMSEAPETFLFEEIPSYVTETRLGGSIAESISMMARIEKIRRSLPGIDCGACGAPNCRANAEDAVRQGLQTVYCPILEAAGKREEKHDRI